MASTATTDQHQHDQREQAAAELADDPMVVALGELMAYHAEHLRLVAEREQEEQAR